MKFLIDQNLPPLVAKLLCDSGHDAVHTSEIGMRRSDDTDIFDRAVTEERTIVSADTDFGTLLAERGTDRPSLILLRRNQDRRAAAITALILANLDTIEEPLTDGAVVVMHDRRLRIRQLPLR